MPRYEKEIRCGFDSFLEYRGIHKDGLYAFKFGEEELEGYFETTDEDENEFEENDPRYEEFNTIIFRGIEGSYFEINYLDLPDEIYHEGKLIYRNENGILKRIED